MAQQARGSGGRQGRHASPLLRHVPLHQVLGDGQYVTRPLRQRQPAQREDVQTIEEILAKQSGRHRLAQLAVAGGDDPHIQRNRLAAAQPLHLPLLQHPQQLGLQRQVHLGDLIEQQGTTLRLFKLARASLNRAGEGPLLVTEQRRLQHVLRDGGTVDGDEGLLGATGLIVDITSQHLFAGATGAGHHDGGIRTRHPGRQLQQLGGLGIAVDRGLALDALSRHIAADLIEQHLR